MEGSASITSNSFGGVFIPGGTFIMQGGTISGNSYPSANINEGKNISYKGPGVNNRGGTFIMRGGTISGNSIEAGGSGGGVSVDNGGTFTMEGGTISGNSILYGYDGLAAPGGGVCVGSNGTFTMRDGTISGNKAGDSSAGSGRGGGVYVSGGGTFTMQGGTISGNTAGRPDAWDPGAGGGVYVYTSSYGGSGTFIKTGGTIYGNNESNASFRNISGDTRGHAVFFGDDYYRDSSLAANTGGNISTATPLPSAAGQTLNNWTRRVGR